MKTKKEHIKEIVLEAGFHLVGISSPSIPKFIKENYKRWISNDFFGNMHYMARNIEKRLNPSRLVSGVKSIVVMGVSYFSPTLHNDIINDPEMGIVSLYAIRSDYHKVIKKKLKALYSVLKEKAGISPLRGFVDTAPVLERQFGAQSGIGFWGKNNMLINPQIGSLFFLSEIFLADEVEPDAHLTSTCGTCNLCVDACPTGALSSPFHIDASKCISYVTIEHKGPIPMEIMEKMGNRTFGCDECVRVCPFNKVSLKIANPFFGLRERMDIFAIPLVKLLTFTEDQFKITFNGTPVVRAGYLNFMRNVMINCVHTKNPEILSKTRGRCRDFNQFIEWGLCNWVDKSSS